MHRLQKSDVLLERKQVFFFVLMWLSAPQPVTPLYVRLERTVVGLQGILPFFELGRRMSMVLLNAEVNMINWVASVVSHFLEF